MNLFKKLFGRKIENQLSRTLVEFDLDTLLESENQNDSIIAIDDYVSGLCIHGDDLSHLSQPQRNFYYIQELEREPHNGGFWQYFINSAGDCAHETIIALEAIGAKNASTILKSAINEFPTHMVPKKLETRQDIIEQIEPISAPVWHELNEEFYNYKDDLNALNIQYIKANKEYF